MTDVDGLRLELRHVLDQTEKWLNTGFSLELGAELDQRKWLEQTVRTVRQLRTRAASSMINVALLGGFSSGKSFLVGALQGRLEYAPVTDDDGMTSDQYIGLLHSASKATTACPATVVPVEEAGDVDVSGKGFYRVRFTDGNGWEDIGNSPVPAVVAAYTTQDTKAIVRGRTAQHRERTVAEVEILLGEFELPAKLYDLPGHGSPHPVHDEIANSAWAEADCFIYTVQATQTLSRVDLELINRLYTHHLNSGKRVIWVMTGIDRAAMVDQDGRPAWKEAVEANNAYLRENFPPAPNRLDTFVGSDGFVPVSPAWEALGKWHVAQGDVAKGEKFIAASRMRRLRSDLADLINSGAGRRHIATVAVEAHTLLSPGHQTIAELLDSARLPLEQLSGEREDLSRRLNHLKSAIATVRDQLEGALRHHVRQTDRSFRNLSNHLHTELDSQILTANLTRERS